MTRLLYLETTAGISGDMLVGALLDVGVDERALKSALASLPLDGYGIHVSRVSKSGIEACDFSVDLDDPTLNRDHDMEYLFGEDAASHEHREHHASHEHHHRTFADVRAIIEGGSLKPDVAALALRIFEILAQAEAEAHGVSVDEVHFHEVGAVDSIVDIVAAAFCVDALAVDGVIVPALHEGAGTIRCQHGLIPIPTPAVASIARTHQLPIIIEPIEAELTTPTGAAIVAAICTSHRLPEPFFVDAVGYGAGKRDYATSGLLRAFLIHPEA